MERTNNLPHVDNDQSHEVTVYSSHLSCPSCGRSTRHGQPYTKWGFPIRECSQCGLGSSVLPEGFSADAIYDRGYFQGGRADGYSDYAASASVLRREFRRVLQRLQQSVPSGNLLEIGCAYGYLLEEASSRYACQGVELSAAAREVCHAKGLDVRGSLDELDCKTSFDAVVMLDVIEHLVSPLQTLTRVRSQMPVGGRLVVTTGDWGSPLAKLSGKNWRLMTPPQHLWFFTQPSLKQLLERAGFETERIDHPGKIVPLDLIFYQLTRRHNIACRLPSWVANVGIPVNLWDAVSLTAIAR